MPGKAICSSMRSGTSFLDQHPLDTSFVMDIPEELLPYFNRWAAERGFIPEKPGIASEIQGRH